MILYSKESSDHLPEVSKYLYGARTAHCGVRDLFLKSSQAIFCRIRYSSSVYWPTTKRIESANPEIVV